MEMISGFNEYIRKADTFNISPFFGVLQLYLSDSTLLQILSFYLLGITENNQGSVHKCKTLEI
jgi:hypothetical protein